MSRLGKLLSALSRVTHETTFQPVVTVMREILCELGVQVDRIQLPMTRYAGFRHPTLSAVVVTWTHTDEFAQSFTLGHGQLGERVDLAQGSVDSPYKYLVNTGRSFWRVDLTQPSTFRGLAVLEKLRERGYRDYCVLRLPMPGEALQMFSIASLQGFPEDLEERLVEVTESFGIAVFAAYRSSQAWQLAHTYIGPWSGPRVLAGDIRRGSTRRLRAGILFCDIRGFTALSERVSPEEVVGTVNELFAIVEREASAFDGEILKFIGDAMLLVFPEEGRDEASVAHALVETARRSLQAVESMSLGIGMCFGATIGEVIQGNLGTPQRLDFTVMGSKVNLASRLESLCRPVDAEALFCTTVAKHVDTVQSVGKHSLKGISKPVEVFQLRREGPSPAHSTLPKS